MTPRSTCKICESELVEASRSGNSSRIKCPRCGEYCLGDLAAHEISFWTPQQKSNLSGWIRENQGSKIFEKELNWLNHLPTPTVGEKADKLLLWLSHNYPKAGMEIQVFTEPICQFVSSEEGKPRTKMNASTKPEFLARSWTQDTEEFLYLFLEYAAKEKRYVEIINGSFCRITPTGWFYIDSLRQGNPQSQIGFIAMWFNTEVNDAWKAIDRGIGNAGYEALRIDQKQHNNKIDDEIVAGIRRSKFLVADFTGHRGGVYFEAGMAMGLGLPVIWLCRHDHLKEIHFDTRQYNFIVWDADRLDDLSKALKNRIEATIGRGPLQSAT